MNRPTTRGLRVAFFHADMDEQQTPEPSPETPKARYPKRPSHFAHKFVRRLAKSAAAQEIGPEACWLLTVIAHQEDAVHYRRAVTWYEGQLMPLVGLKCRRTLARVRDKAIEAGWLHYEPGRKGVAGVYWVLIPDHAEPFDDSPIGDDQGVLCDTSVTERAPKVSQQQRQKSAGSVTQMSPEERPMCHTSNPNPNPNPIPVSLLGESAARAPDPGFNPNPPPHPVDDIQTPDNPHIDWLTVEREFLVAWNAAPETVHISALRNYSNRLRTMWMDPWWRDNWRKVFSILPTSYWAVRKLPMSKFLEPNFVEETLNGKYRDYTGTAGTHAVGNAAGATPSFRTIGRRVERSDNGGYGDDAGGS